MPRAPEAVAELDDAVLPLEERLARRLEVLRGNRARFITDVQRQLAALDAAIGELSALIDPAPAEQNGTGPDA